jgi:hypothetical protein
MRRCQTGQCMVYDLEHQFLLLSIPATGILMLLMSGLANSMLHHDFTCVVWIQLLVCILNLVVFKHIGWIPVPLLGFNLASSRSDYLRRERILWNDVRSYCRNLELHADTGFGALSTLSTSTAWKLSSTEMVRLGLCFISSETYFVVL